MSLTLLNGFYRRTPVPHSPARCHLPMHAVILLLMIVAAAQADVYRWTDATGQVHYGDRPSEQVQYERVKVDNPPPSGPSTGLRPGEQKMLQDVRKEKRRADQEHRAQAHEEAHNSRRQAAADARRRDRCDRYERCLRGIENKLTAGYSVGESYSLQERRDEYEAKIREYCD